MLGKSLLIIKRLVSMFYYEKTYFFTEIEFFLASTSYKPQIKSDELNLTWFEEIFEADKVLLKLKKMI